MEYEFSFLCRKWIMWNKEEIYFRRIVQAWCSFSGYMSLHWIHPLVYINLVQWNRCSSRDFMGTSLLFAKSITFIITVPKLSGSDHSQLPMLRTFLTEFSECWTYDWLNEPFIYKERKHSTAWMETEFTKKAQVTELLKDLGKEYQMIHTTE
jgi:hypothetical protein